MTNRGFCRVVFEDSYGEPCSLQMSSNMEPNVWLGLDEVTPTVEARRASSVGVFTAETTGWVDYPLPGGVHIFTRMHVDQGLAAELWPVLKRFAEAGELEIAMAKEEEADCGE